MTEMFDDLNRVLPANTDIESVQPCPNGEGGVFLSAVLVTSNAVRGQIIERRLYPVAERSADRYDRDANQLANNDPSIVAVSAVRACVGTQHVDEQAAQKQTAAGRTSLNECLTTYVFVDGPVDPTPAPVPEVIDARQGRLVSRIGEAGILNVVTPRGHEGIFVTVDGATELEYPGKLHPTEQAQGLLTD